MKPKIYTSWYTIEQASISDQKNMKYCGVATLICLAFFNISVQAQSSRELLVQGMASLADASNRRDLDQILNAREILEQIPADDSLAIWAHYYAGAASSDLANLLAEEGRSGRKREIAGHLNNAIDHLEAAVKIDPAFAEGWMLLSSAYVHKISVRPFKALGLSRKYNRARDRAVELEPMNPRIKLMKGIIDYSLPGIVGGDKTIAEQEMEEALLLFETEVIDHPFRPAWGHDQAHARLGVVYMDRGDYAEARTAFMQSLELNPEFGWVKDILLPSLDKLESTSSSD